MSSMWHQVAILIVLYWIWSQVSASGEIFQSNVMLTWNDARKHCEEKGKVLLNAQKNDSGTSLMKILKDTNETWVSARVEFSHFVKVPVCMETSKHFGPKESFDTDIIESCLKFCSGHVNAGLNDRDCYCLNDSSKLTRSMSCNSTCDNDPFHQCGGNNSVSLFEKVDKIITHKIVHGCKECVYARTTGGDLKLFAESCVGHVSDSAICEAVKYTECRTIKWTVVGDNLCRMNQVDSLRWKQAKKYCADIGGNLMSSSVPKINNMIENSTYWIGFYRIPMIHKVNALELLTNDTCCAIARREGELVLIEGDDCRAKHVFICQDKDILEGVTHSTESYGKGTNYEHADGKIIYGVVAASAMLLVALVITAFICIFRRRQVSQERVNISATHSTRDQHAVQERDIINPLYEPLRHIHNENDNLQSSYLTVIFDRGSQDVAIEKPGCSHFD